MFTDKVWIYFRSSTLSMSKFLYIKRVKICYRCMGSYYELIPLFTLLYTEEEVAAEFVGFEEEDYYDDYRDEEGYGYYID